MAINAGAKKGDRSLNGAVGLNSKEKDEEVVQKDKCDERTKDDDVRIGKKAIVNE